MNAVFLLPLHVLAVVGRGIASRLGSDVSSTMGEAAVAEADLLGMVVHNLVERYSIGAGWQSAGSGSKSTDDGARFATGSNITELVDWVVVCAELYAQSGVLKSPQQSKQMFRSLLSSTFNGDEAAWHEHYAKTPHLQESGEPVGTHPTSKMFSNLASVTHVSHPTSPHGAQLSRRQHGRASTSKSDAGGALPTAAPMSTTVGRQRLAGGSGEETLLTPLEAEWKRFVTPLSMESRAQLQHLLYETTLGVDVLQSIVQQLYLVEQADVFLSPVPPTTVMEYDGVRSGPYCSVVLQPQSLYLVTKDVAESRRELPAPNTPAATAEPAQLATTSHSRRIVTLAELERSVWHIATNCVVFNAPDSFYPRTARSFALSCTRVIQQYCRQHLGL